MAKRSYQGKDTEITFDDTLCIHARECVTSLPKVFVANAPGDWIQPDEASAEEIAALAHVFPRGPSNIGQWTTGWRRHRPRSTESRYVKTGRWHSTPTSALAVSPPAAA